MSRLFSLKTCLFFLIVVVVGLTIVLIARCHILVSRPNEDSWSFIKKKTPGVAPVSVGGGGSNNYYQALHDEEYAETAKKSKVGEKVHAPSSLSDIKKAIHDYPFEDDFDNNEKNEGAKAKKADDDMYAYAVAHKAVDSGKGNKNLQDITCDINHGKQFIGCKKVDGEVFIPFNFLQKYFEVSGKISDEDASKFIWLHSQAKIYRPKTAYDPKGIFTYFENYNVEVRERVKCVSGPEGVPVSTQWDSNGYFYPIQIAQFGLSHYSKYLVEGEPTRIVLENGENVRGKWLTQKGSEVVPVPDPGNPSSTVVSFAAKPTRLLVSPTKSRMLVLSWNMKTDNTLGNSNVDVNITVTVRYETQLYYLNYITADYLIKTQDNYIYHGLGSKSMISWQHVIRDLGVDVQKGVLLTSSGKKARNAPKIIKSKLIVESIIVTTTNCRLYLDNLTLSTNEHLAQFFQAADWFVSSQDNRGGWPIPVRRKFASDFYPVLESGWYSAMGQGHALSLLSRAYALNKDKSEYSRACVKALEHIFDAPGNQHGVRAVFMDKYVWYEEYPTTPSTFVLNGFMYALLGLYDVSKIGVEGAVVKARALYDDGLKSLKTMLPLYDTGSGTMYDLRHFTVPGISPNLARLDYHVTHINQLLTFATFEEDPIFAATAERWKDYTEGKRAPHN